MKRRFRVTQIQSERLYATPGIHWDWEVIDSKYSSADRGHHVALFQSRAYARSFSNILNNEALRRGRLAATELSRAAVTRREIQVNERLHHGITTDVIDVDFVVVSST